MCVNRRFWVVALGVLPFSYAATRRFSGTLNQGKRKNAIGQKFLRAKIAVAAWQLSNRDAKFRAP